MSERDTSKASLSPNFFALMAKDAAATLAEGGLDALVEYLRDQWHDAPCTRSASPWGKDHQHDRWNLKGVSGALIDASNVVVDDDDYGKSIRELTRQRNEAFAKGYDAGKAKVATLNKSVDPMQTPEYGAIVKLRNACPCPSSEWSAYDNALRVLYESAPCASPTREEALAWAKKVGPAPDGMLASAAAPKADDDAVRDILEQSKVGAAGMPRPTVDEAMASLDRVHAGMRASTDKARPDPEGYLVQRTDAEWFGAEWREAQRTSEAQPRIWHHMPEPGVAACGADYPTIAKTEVIAHVTCERCKAVLVSQQRSGEAIPPEPSGPLMTGPAFERWMEDGNTEGLVIITRDEWWKRRESAKTSGVPDGVTAMSSESSGGTNTTPAGGPDEAGTSTPNACKADGCARPAIDATGWCWEHPKETPSSCTERTLDEKLDAQRDTALEAAALIADRDGAWGTARRIRALLSSGKGEK